MISFDEFMSSRIDEDKELELQTNFEVEIEKNETINEKEEKQKIEETDEESSTIDMMEGYKIYRDKAESFICDMEISGANPTNSKARIIIESKDLTYMFEGTVDPQGRCKIPLKKMNFLEENETGTIKLEVIAEDTVFTPWEETFVAVTSKKVSVKTFESENNDSIKIGVRLKNIR